MGIRTIQFLQGVTAPFLLLIGVALLAWAVVKAGGFGPMLAAPSKFQDVRRIFPIFCAVAHRRGGILGHRGAEHSGFHALRAQPARAGARPGAGLAGDDDVLFLHRRRRHLGHGDYFRPGDLGSGPGARASGKSHRRRDGDAGAAAGHAERERRGQSGFAVQRFLESLAAADQFSHRRPDCLRRGRGRVSALEAARQLQQLHFRTGWWAIPDFSARSRE